ncbi:uncharacterized protein LOC131659088 [Vicia villosa]|uniref:uncharacterized protein LOC131659088 n=1 Tax=Vicia villosa TaxID=3911 RepID=UPI00273CCA9E|nr:uncharacterized protein LOC131659088 [Vicia villosa]
MGGAEDMYGPTQIFPLKSFPDVSLSTSSNRANFGSCSNENHHDESDIVRCNIRTLSNSGNACDEKLCDAISKLGVVPGHNRREIQKKFSETQTMDAIGMEGKKRQLWSRLLELKNRYQDGEWIIGGDFNAVKKRSERIGQSLRISNVEWREFSDFIDDCGLVDGPCKGKKFVGLVGMENQRRFFCFMEEEWKGIIVQGRGDFVLKEKFRLIKERLKWWDKNVFGKVDLEVEEGVRDLNALDDMEFWEEEVKEAVRIHFEDKFKEECLERPLLVGIAFKSLSEVDSLSLEVPFSLEEIKDAMWSCDGSKSMGPDGLDGYRPICLVGSIYKMISKLLACRIKKVLSLIISNCQSAFVLGRQMIDGVLIANEVVDYPSREGKECLLFKVDFEKAYDKVSWNFLRYMLRRMGFGKVWMSWMEAMVFSSKMSVLVNGSPTKKFIVERGLRQGDPISPFLFVVVAEGLKALVGRTVENGDFVGINMNGRCFIDMLQFTNDTLLIGDGSWKHLWAIKAALRGFEMVSGLGINYHKSKLIGIIINPHFMGVATNFLTCRTEDKEFKFLVIFIGTNPTRISSWKPLLDNVRRRLNSWKGRWLNFGGRITLLKSVLSSLAIFTLSFYKAPKKVIAELNKLKSNFLRGGSEEKRKVHWVSWNDLCIPVEKGGLGFRRLDEFNKALLLKWNWRIFGASNALWFRMLKARYTDVKLRTSCGIKNLEKDRSSSVWCISFWHAHWLDEGILKNIFLNLYNFSLLQEASIGAMGGWIDGQHIPLGPENRFDMAFMAIWKVEAHLKVKAFGWRCFLNKVPTKDSLLSKGILNSSSNLECTFYDEFHESLYHSFLSCWNAGIVWREMSDWIGKTFRSILDFKEDFWYWSSYCRAKKVKRGKEGTVWLAIIWSLWSRRNDIVFNNATWNSRDVVWSYKALIWRRSYIGKITHPNCNFYEFSNNPLFYLS